MTHRLLYKNRDFIKMRAARGQKRVQKVLFLAHNRPIDMSLFRMSWLGGGKISKFAENHEKKAKKGTKKTKKDDFRDIFLSILIYRAFLLGFGPTPFFMCF